MPDPSRSAGGTPDDWSNSKKGGCDKIFGLILLVGVVSLAQLIGVINLVTNLI